MFFSNDRVSQLEERMRKIEKERLPEQMDVMDRLTAQLVTGRVGNIVFIIY